MPVDSARYATLRELRKTRNLTREERDEWQVLDAQRQINKARRRQQIARGRASKRLVARKIELGGILLEAGIENNDPQQLRRAIAAGKAAINAGIDGGNTEQPAAARVSGYRQGDSRAHLPTCSAVGWSQRLTGRACRQTGYWR